MTYFPKTKIELADSPSIDAFGRLRTGHPTTLFDDKQISTIRDLFWSYRFLLNATASFSIFRASNTLTSSATIGSVAVRQSKNSFPYQPGKSLSTHTSFVFGTSTPGVRKRTGYFNDLNGIYFEDDGGNKNICIRSSVTGAPVNQAISQSNWNLDTFDGTGPSGVALDFSKVQILDTDMQWLGSGRIRVGFDVNGQTFYAHQFLHSNVSSSVYMSNPNLPMRSEVENISASTTGTLETICCTVISEAGYKPNGVLRSINRGTSALTNVTTEGFFPILTMRLGQNFTGSTINPTTVQVLCTSNATFLWEIVFNPSFGPADAPSWVTVPSSSIEYDISRTVANALTGGIVIASGYGTNTYDLQQAAISTGQTLGSTINGVSDQLVLAVKTVTGTTETFYGSISWHEYF